MRYFYASYFPWVTKLRQSVRRGIFNENSVIIFSSFSIKKKKTKKKHAVDTHQRHIENYPRIIMIFFIQSRFCFCYPHDFFKKRWGYCERLLPFVRPSRSLPLYHCSEFNQTCYRTSPHGKGVREQIIFLPVRPASVHLSVMLSPPKRNLTKLATWFPLMVRVCGSNINFLSGVRPSVRYAVSSLTTGWNLIKLATRLPLMVRVCESNIIFPSVRPAGVSPSARHAISS